MLFKLFHARSLLRLAKPTKTVHAANPSQLFPNQKEDPARRGPDEEVC